MRPCRPRPRPRLRHRHRLRLSLLLESLEVEMRREPMRCSLVGGWRVALRYHGPWPMGIIGRLHRLEPIPLLLLPLSASGLPGPGFRASRLPGCRASRLPGCRASRGSVTTWGRHGDFLGEPARTGARVPHRLRMCRRALLSNPPDRIRSHPVPPDPTRSHPIPRSSARVRRSNPCNRARESKAQRGCQYM